MDQTTVENLAQDMLTLFDKYEINVDHFAVNIAVPAVFFTSVADNFQRISTDPNAALFPLRGKN